MRNEILEEVKRVIREGFSWPGGYPFMVVMSDGGVLCTKCAREEYAQVAWATKTGDQGGWGAVGIDIEFGEENQCDHCGEFIDPALNREEEL